MIVTRSHGVNVFVFVVAHVIEREATNYKPILKSLPTTSFSASSSLNSSTLPHFSRSSVETDGGWFAAANDLQPWIQVDFGRPRMIIAILLFAPKHSPNTFVKTYAVLGGIQHDYLAYLIQYDVLITGRSSRVLEFRKIHLIRYIRINAARWENHAALSWEIDEASSKFVVCHICLYCICTTEINS